MTGAHARLVGWWDFEGGSANDRTGNFGSTGLMQGARLENGALALEAAQGAYAQTGRYHGLPVHAKTLVAWAFVDRHDRGGSLLTLENHREPQVFDGIVFAERESLRWMAGSEFFERSETQAPTGVDETSGPLTLVKLAITYELDGTITIYRNDRLYHRYRRKPPPLFLAADAVDVVFGLRHSAAGTPQRYFTGRIEEARLYDEALSPEQLQALTPEVPAGRSGVEKAPPEGSASQRPARAQGRIQPGFLSALAVFSVLVWLAFRWSRSRHDDVIDLPARRTEEDGPMSLPLTGEASARRQASGARPSFRRRLETVVDAVVLLCVTLPLLLVLLVGDPCPRFGGVWEGTTCRMSPGNLHTTAWLVFGVFTAGGVLLALPLAFLAMLASLHLKIWRYAVGWRPVSTIELFMELATAIHLMLVPLVAFAWARGYIHPWQ